MAKIALVSDVHLGTRQYGIPERYEDFLAAFGRFGEGVRGNADAVVIGGDLFDSPRPDARSVLKAMEVVRGIPVPVWGIDGNHDLSGGDWLRAIGANVFPDYATVEIVPGVHAAGLSYLNGRDLVAAIGRMADAGVKADILVAHFALAEMNGGGSADTGVQELSPLLERMGVKAVLMGHVHIPDCRRWNGILYVNPGSTEMKSANEPPEKYYFVLDTDTWEAREVPLETREMETVEIADEASLAAFMERLASESRAVAGGAPGRPFYQIVADDSVDDAFKRLAATLHDASALGRIVVRSSRARDLAPVVDRKEGVATLASAIEARFPKESDEARLTASLLHSPEPSAIHMIVDRYMSEGSGSGSGSGSGAGSGAGA